MIKKQKTKGERRKEKLSKRKSKSNGGITQRLQIHFCVSLMKTWESKVEHCGLRVENGGVSERGWGPLEPKRRSV